MDAAVRVSARLCGAVSVPKRGSSVFTHAHTCVLCGAAHWLGAATILLCAHACGVSVQCRHGRDVVCGVMWCFCPSKVLAGNLARKWGSSGPPE